MNRERIPLSSLLPQAAAILVALMVVTALLGRFAFGQAWGTALAVGLLYAVPFTIGYSYLVHRLGRRRSG